MNYVEHFNLFGIEAKENPSIKGEGVPSSSTKGLVGMLYINTLTGGLYKCVSATDNSYIWEDVNKATPDQTYNPESEQAQSGKAVAEAVEKFDSLDLLDISHRDKIKGFISSSGKWINIMDSYKFILLPVHGGATLDITSNGSVNGTMACLRGFSGVVENESVDFSTAIEWSKRFDFAGNKQLTIPDDAKYLYIAVVYSGQDCTPIKCEIGGYDYLSSAQKNFQNIQAMIGGIENGSY